MLGDCSRRRGVTSYFERQLSAPFVVVLVLVIELQEPDRARRRGRLRIIRNRAAALNASGACRCRTCRKSEGFRCRTARLRRWGRSRRRPRAFLRAWWNRSAGRVYLPSWRTAPGLRCPGRTFHNEIRRLAFGDDSCEREKAQGAICGRGKRET